MSETSFKEKITLLEDQLKELTVKLEGNEINYKDVENKFLGNISQLKESVREKEEKIICLTKEHQEN